MLDLDTTQKLAEFCQTAEKQDFVTIDTEFLREKTYYSKLCLLQMALPSGEVAYVDPIENKIDFAPLLEMFANASVTKVFHAGRQDLEIFWHMGSVIPEPLFDTQIAAMVCGFGEQVGYETLVKKIVNQPLDKSSRFTDWSRRPLTDRQLNYAIGDVTHLRDIYMHLNAMLQKNGREEWVQEELLRLLAPETYETLPEDAWKKLRIRTNSPKILAVIREIAAFREREAQARNVPKNRLFKDDVIQELSATQPRTMEDLSRSRLLQKDARKGWIAEGILTAVQAGLDCPKEERPKAANNRTRLNGSEAMADLMRVLLKAKSEQFGVAPRLIATTAELDAFVANPDKRHAVQHGWRYDVFGRDAEALLEGKVAISTRDSKVTLVPVS